MPPKLPPNRIRSKSVPVRKSAPELIKKIPNSADSHLNRVERTKVTNKLVTKKPQKTDYLDHETQSIILDSGCLKLAVKFPSDSMVKLKRGRREKILIRNACNCQKFNMAV